MAVTAIQLVGMVGLLLAQNRPAVELEGAIAREQVSGDLKAAIAAYQKISTDTSAPRDVRAKALLHLATCYEKLGRQQSRAVYEQIVREYADQSAAIQARARLASYSGRSEAIRKTLMPRRLTSNTPELTIQSAGLSPDGQRIAFSDQLGIHVRSIEGNETRLLANTQGHLFIRWLPDSNSLQTQAQNNAGEMKISQISISGGPAQSWPPSEQYLPSPTGNLRAKTSPDLTRVYIQTSSDSAWREIWAAPGKHTIDQIEWNPSGRAIAVLSVEYGTNGYQSPSTLELIDVSNGGSRKAVLIGPKANVVIGAIAWSAANRLIMTINKDTGPNQYESNLWEIRLANNQAPSRSGPRQLTDWKDFPIRAGCLSVVGKRILFIRSFRQRDVYVASLAAGGKQMGNPRRLTLDLADDYPSDWTRDSKAVILTSTRNGSQAIFRQDIDKVTADEIVHLPGHQVLARATPDGQSILVMAMAPDKAPKSFRLMAAPIGGGEAIPVPNTQNPGIFYRCSPAGKCLDAQKAESGEYVVSELSLTKGFVREIYRDKALQHPDISPDGQWIADSAQAANGLTKIVIRSFATGQIAREILVPGTTQLFSFGYAPDGQGFFASDALLAEVRELYIDQSGRVSVLYREPKSVFGIWGVPSPDGKYLALVLLTDDSNVYTVEEP